VQSWVQGSRRVAVVQANWASRYIGKMIVTFDKNGEITNLEGSPILLGGKDSDNWESEDQAIKEEILECVPRIAALCQITELYHWLVTLSNN
jgi:2',3'-cyclic-nucleotide 2'-phosphodiesterase (5'-nucleotidase family)